MTLGDLPEPLRQAVLRLVFSGGVYSPDPAQRPEVIYCVNDAMALGVLDAARFALMLQVPQDVSIVGFDNIPAGQRPAYRLTTVSQPFDALAEREAASSTGVGYGVAVPHARLEGLQRMRAVFVRLDHPVAFESVDDQPVDLIFALFAPPNASTEHLRTLPRVSRLLRQADLREQLRQARTPDAIHALLVQEARSSAA